MYNYHEIPAALFYLERNNSYWDAPGLLLDAAKDDKQFYCLIHESDLAPMRDQLSKMDVGVAGSFENLWLLEKKGNIIV